MALGGRGARQRDRQSQQRGRGRGRQGQQAIPGASSGTMDTAARVGLVFMVMIDVLCSLACTLSVHDWKVRNISWSIGALLSFKTDFLDTSVLACARVLVLTFLMWLAVYVGKPRQPAREGYSLVVNEDPEEDFVETERRLKQAQNRATLRSNFVLAALFIFLTGNSVLTGIKAVLFEYHNEAVQGTLSVVVALMVNSEYYVAKYVIQSLLTEEGQLIPGLHNHPLHFADDLASHLCDLCTARIKKEAYRCKMCDFDVCVTCFIGRSRNGGEGLLRGDKGIKDEIEVTNKAYFMRSMSLAYPFWPVLLPAMLALIGSKGSSLFLPHFQGSILDAVNHKDGDLFYSQIKIFLTLSLTTGFFGGIQTLCINIVGRLISREVRDRLFKSIITQDIAFFDGNNTGQLTARMTNDANAMTQPMRILLNSLLSNIILLLGGVVLCFWTSWKLSTLAFTAIGPITHATGLYAKWSRHINRQIWDALAEANKVATEAFSNIRTVRAFSTEDHEIGRFTSATGEALQKGIRDAVVGGGTNMFNQYVDLSAGVLVIWYGGSVVLNDPDQLTIGKLVTFQLYWNTLNGAYMGLNDIINSFTRAAGAAQRVLSLIDMKPDIHNEDGLVMDSLQGAIRMEHVEFFYQMRPDNKVLKGITLDIKPGSIVALVGRSGGGKSTIIHLLMRFYDPKEGKILFDGEDLCNLNVKWVHQNMGLVAQDTQLFAGTILQNITYGMEENEWTMEDVTEATKMANAYEFITGFEDGFKTRVGERGVRLSGGQKQRIAVARVLLRKPKVLLLDEATSALDTVSEALVQEALDTMIRTLQGGCTVVVVAHRLSTVMNADSIAVISEGQVAEQGTHQELVDMGGIYNDLVCGQIAKGSNNLPE